MKRVYIFLVSALLLVSLYSCSTYRNTQTPDDVYYSPGVPATQAASAQTNNSDYYSTPNDNYVRMRVQDPNRWSYFDDYGSDYYANNYGYGYGYGSGVGLSFGFGSGFYSPFYGGFGYYSPLSFYNSYYAWNNFYNPYYGGVLIVNGKNTAAPGYTRMANFNPSAYQGRYYNTRPASNFSNGNSNRTSQNYYNRNNNFNRSNDSRPNYYSPSPTRSSNFSSGGSSGGGGGASRGGGFSRPGR